LQLPTQARGVWRTTMLSGPFLGETWGCRIRALCQQKRCVQLSIHFMMPGQIVSTRKMCWRHLVHSFTEPCNDKSMWRQHKT
jgi:hypothetical protein